MSLLATSIRFYSWVCSLSLSLSMGARESRCEKIERYSEETQDRIQDLNSKYKDFERQESKLSVELDKIPRTKVSELRAKAKRIAAIRVRKTMTDAARIQLEAMDQNFQNLLLQNSMMESMMQTNTMIKDINEETNMASIRKLIQAFEKNLNNMATDQSNLSSTLEGTLEGMEANTDYIVNDILIEHNIKLEQENRQLTSLTAAQPQQSLSPVYVPPTQQSDLVAVSSVADRFDSFKQSLASPPQSKQ